MKLQGFINVETSRSLCVEDEFCDLCIDVNDFYVYQVLNGTDNFNADICLDVITKHCLINEMEKVIQEDCFNMYNNTEIESCSNYIPLLRLFLVFSNIVV